MIEIDNPEQCCGCSACEQVCPRRCIALREDAEGCLYPVVDKNVCISCGSCLRVCPVLHPGEPREPSAVYAARARNESIRRESSSGGLFTLLAERTLRAGGIVFGAGFDAFWQVTHRGVETEVGLKALRGSKYVQSRMGDCFTEVSAELKKGRKVLFCGTPCQAAGLRRYLGKDHPLLLTVDFVCHGVPVPRAWSLYLDELLASCGFGRTDVSRIDFRSKRNGWKRSRFELAVRTPAGERLLCSEPSRYNPFMRGFLRNLFLRPVCHACPVRDLRSGSDLTLGDCWGIDRMAPTFDDDRGASLLLVHTRQGEAYSAGLDAERIPLSYPDVCKGNPSLLRSALPPPGRAFFQARAVSEGFGRTVSRMTCESRSRYWIRSIGRLFLRMVPFYFKTDKSL